MPMTTLVIGRSPFADIVLVDATVGSHHAELVITEDGRLYLTDCASLGGTWRRRAGEDGGEDDWTPLRQDFIRDDEPLRFGRYVATAASLLTQVRGSTRGVDNGGDGRHDRGDHTTPPPSRPADEEPAPPREDGARRRP